MAENESEKKIEEAKKRIEAIKKSGITGEAKKVGMMGALLGGSTDSLINSMVAASNVEESRKAEKEAPNQKAFADYTPVEKQVAKMLTENTGIHMIDSGGAYGRAWQRNREVEDFRLRPAVTVGCIREPMVVRVPQPIVQKLAATAQRAHVSVPLLQRAIAKPQKVPIPAIAEAAKKEPKRRIQKKETEPEKERLRA